MKTIKAYGLLVPALVAIGGSAAMGCQGGTGEAVGSTSQALEALVPLGSCGEVETLIRDRARADVNKRIDEALAQIEKSEYACSYYGGGYGSDAAGSAPAPSAGSGSSSSSGGSSGGAPSNGGSKASESSGTNNQVAGVDEADFVKNDGQYLYLALNGALRIVKAWPANEMAPVSKTPIDGTVRKLFVEGDRAVVYVSVPREPKPSTGSSGDSVGSGGAPYPGGSSRSECTYGYDCVPTGDGQATKVLVFDIANRAAPQKIRELSLSGSLLSARRIGDAVHTVVVDSALAIPGLSYYPEDLQCGSGDDVITYKAKAKIAFESLRTKNLAAIAAADLHGNLPSIKENGIDAVGACDGFYRANAGDGSSFTSIVSFDIAGGAPKSATVVSSPGVVYASETNLYMSVPQQRAEGASWYPGFEGEEQASTVHQFRVGATSSLTGYQASGVVKGRVLNQFAMDEHEGNLRIATTTGHAPSDKTHSTLSILGRQGNSLAVRGKVDNIAPTEDIRSVRFDGTRGFVVTFKKTDPLYVFDLGNPTAPSIAGELKIPGFSTYMHMMDAQHLLTIGYDAADQGDFAWFTGVMLQIFDVSDMRNPRLAHKEVIGTRGSSSEALTNHLAFNYYAPKNLLSLPMTICEGGDANGGYGTNMTFAGLLVYDVTTAGGFAQRGRVAHPQTTSGGYDSGACSNWWTQASSEVQRSVVMEDFVYSISQKRVKVNGLTNLASDIREVSLND